MFTFRAVKLNIKMTEIRYSIKDLENYTDIKAHTIRIWEQRYQLLTPKRTDTNRRYYGEDDFKKLLNINLLYLNGLKISKIANLSEEQIVKQAKELIYSADSDKNGVLNEMIVAILAFDKATLLRLIYKRLDKYTLDVYFQDTIIPLLEKIGKLWQVNSFEVVHEHFFSMILKEVIMDQIQKLPETEDNKKNALLFLHDEEEHEFGLLIYYYMLKKNGYNVFNLGPKVPVDEITQITTVIQPEIAATTFTAVISEDDLNKIIAKIEKVAPMVFISGGQLKRHNVSSSGNIQVLNKLMDLSDKLN